MDLRLTETNAADDSAGRVFGLDGNLYLPVVVAGVTAVGLFVLVGLVFRAGFVLGGTVAAAPLAGTLAWAAFLKHRKPAGYDRDKVEDFLGGGNFTRVSADQAALSE